MFNDIIKEEEEITWEELQGYLPHPLFIKPMSKEKWKLFIKMMSEFVIEHKKKESLQSKENIV